MRDKGDFERITKKEALILSRQIDRLEMLLGGIRNMNGLPDLLFVVDVRREDTAIHEANLLNIPVIALVDTNCDPRSIDYVIPSNDDAIRAIKLLVGKIADAVAEGKAMRKEEAEEPALEKMGAHLPETEEPELSDEELLGASTLAKISRPKAVEEEDDEEEENEEEEDDQYADYEDEEEEEGEEYEEEGEDELDEENEEYAEDIDDEIAAEEDEE